MLKSNGHSGDKTKASEKNTNEKSFFTEGNSKIFIFNSLEAVSELALHIKDLFSGKSSLYKNPQNKLYFLILENYPADKNSFGKVCNIASEFSTQNKSNYATSAVITEHCEKIIGEDAVTILSAF